MPVHLRGSFGHRSGLGESGEGFRLTCGDSGSPSLDDDARCVQGPRVHWQIVINCIVCKELHIDESARGDRLEEGKLQPIPIQGEGRFHEERGLGFRHSSIPQLHHSIPDH